jgi:hypothetical protein
MFLGLLLMDYDDFYEPSKGEYFSLACMTARQKMVWIAYNIWIWLNLIAIGLIVYKLVRKSFKQNLKKTNY